MLDNIRKTELRVQLERHLLMVKEVLGRMGQSPMDLEGLVNRIEES